MARNAYASAMIFGFLLAVAAPASAGPHADALGQCFARSITPEEKTTLLRWSFLMFAAHPAVREDAAVAPERRTEMSKKAAKIFERLLSQSCPAESLAASKHEGASGIGTSFSMLSQLAIREMFLDKEVTAALTEFIQHVDKEKLKHVIVPQEK